ncbi:MAG: hypothetical protein ACTSV5_12525 [Promethearchaeota archaeon]
MSEDAEKLENHDQNNTKIIQNSKEVVKKDLVPHFLPTYRISFKHFPIPILIVIVIAGLLAYATYFGAGVQVDGGYFPEEDLGVIAGILNGIIFTFTTVCAAFLIVFLIKKKGIDVLKYIFGFSFGLLGFTLSWFFASVIIFLLFIQFPETPALVINYHIVSDIISPILVAIFTALLLYKYFTSKSINTKNLIVMYISLLISASMGLMMPLWTTLAILIGISLWDIYAVLNKKGPIKEMIDIASKNDKYDLHDKEIEVSIKKGESIYDTSKIEIGIGDLAFYSMLTTSALIQSGNVLIMIFTTIAILIGTGITLNGLKRNKILPGLPISIFLGIATMFLSWYITSLL